MTLECPKCKASIAREGQKFCYRCGNDLREVYAALNIEVRDSASLWDSKRLADDAPATPAVDPAPAPAAPAPPQATQVLGSQSAEVTSETLPAAPASDEPKALLHILLPTGDAYERNLTQAETQIGKGPRNDLVIADPAVSSAHSVIRAEDDRFTISDLGSRNGTFVNGRRLTEPQVLQHGDVIGIGLSKLTFRLTDATDTSATLAIDRTLAIQRPAPPAPTETALAEAVISAGLASQGDVTRLRGEGRGRRLHTALIEDRLATEEALRDLMSRVFQLPTIALQSAQVDPAVAARLTPRRARDKQMVAVGKEGDATILAVADPTDTAAIEEARREIGGDLSLRLATPSAIFEVVDRVYGPRLIAVLPSGERAEYFVSQAETEIGKASHNHIVLNDPTVSNTHAMLLARDGGYSIVDLGSRNGTYVNGERLGTQSHTLRHGDTVQLGQTVLTFRNRAETVANTTATLSPDALAEIRRRAAQMDTSAEREMSAASAPSPQTFPHVDALTPPAFAAARVDLPAVEPAAKANDDGDKDEKGEKKKKKKKKKGADDRLKAAYIGGLSRILAQVFAVVLSVGLALYITSRQMGGNQPKLETNSKGKAKLKLKDAGGTAFRGAPSGFEPSGVIAVPDTEGVLIVDDSRPGEVVWMQVDASGQQVGDSLKVVPLGASVEDPEAITTYGSYFYLVGSQSSAHAGQTGGLVRFTFDAATQTITKAEALTGLRDFLVKNVPELQGTAEAKGSEGGLNIEGLSWDPDHARLLLGLRSPLINGNALIVPIKMRDPSGSFTIDNMQLATANAIQLSLGGLGVRDIQYDSRLKGFLIISGAPEHHEKSEFKLWEWNGDPDQSKADSRPREQATLDARMKPEGVTRLRVGGKDFIFIVGDAGSYSKFDYDEEPAP